MATGVPAALLGLCDRGRLVAGARADLVALDPHDASVREVWLAGRRLGPGRGDPSR
jgi:alpha-D-ribose 1-methylphosphonate 5-triphosphate diphosphatase PhnM